MKSYRWGSVSNKLFVKVLVQMSILPESMCGRNQVVLPSPRSVYRHRFWVRFWHGMEKSFTAALNGESLQPVLPVCSSNSLLKLCEFLLLVVLALLAPISSIVLWLKDMK